MSSAIFSLASSSSLHFLVLLHPFTPVPCCHQARCRISSLAPVLPHLQSSIVCPVLLGVSQVSPHPISGFNLRTKTRFVSRWWRCTTWVTKRKLFRIFWDTGSVRNCSDGSEWFCDAPSHLLVVWQDSSLHFYFCVPAQSGHAGRSSTSNTQAQSTHTEKQKKSLSYYMNKK